ncbi:MAG TPA: hypothetical protein DCZ12_12250 [Gammaproteobacteria bacterium]|nr:hypothetical protein [Gammaproteobacteria bacterium]
MTLFTHLYDTTIRWSSHRFAERYLAFLSFIESSFFPIPPDVMLIPMVVAQPKRSIRLAAITTIFSILGAILGYLIGMFAFEMLEPLIYKMGYEHKYETVVSWFDEWGIWVILVAGFSPLPYKMFTIAAGALSLALIPFIIGSLIGRGARFFLVAQLVSAFGPRIEPAIRQYIEWIGWITVLLLVAVVWYLKG